MKGSRFEWRPLVIGYAVNDTFACDEIGAFKIEQNNCLDGQKSNPVLSRAIGGTNRPYSSRKKNKNERINRKLQIPNEIVNQSNG